MLKLTPSDPVLDVLQTWFPPGTPISVYEDVLTDAVCVEIFLPNGFGFKATLAYNSMFRDDGQATLAALAAIVYDECLRRLPNTWMSVGRSAFRWANLEWPR